MGYRSGRFCLTRTIFLHYTLKDRKLRRRGLVRRESITERKSLVEDFHVEALEPALEHCMKIQRMPALKVVLCEFRIIRENRL